MPYFYPLFISAELKTGKGLQTTSSAVFIAKACFKEDM